MVTRRSFFPRVAAAIGLSAASAAQSLPRKGRLKQSATRGCFGRGAEMEHMAREAARLGLKGLDLIGPKDWPTLKSHGLIATMCPGAGNISRRENREKAEEQLRQNIQLAAEAGMPNVIVTTGNRLGASDEDGIENCAFVLNRVKAVAEDKGVTICLEPLNSKVDHKDYFCDRTWLGVEICKRASSPRVKLLYDIYHMQIMEGDIIRTIRENIQHIGHFHTAGNPGRNEIDDGQELNYRAIAQAIVDLGYTGYFAHEYSPRRDPLASLDQAISICDV